MGRECEYIENLCILDKTQSHWKKYLKEWEILYIYGMTGYGKTSQVIAFAEKNYRRWKRISANQEGFIGELKEVVFSNKKEKVNSLVILDDLQWIQDEDKQRELFNEILDVHRIPNIKLMLISRADVPEYLKPLKVTRQMVVENHKALEFDEEKSRELLKTFRGLQNLSDEMVVQGITAAQKLTKGYPLGLCAFYQRLEKTPDDVETAKALAIQDMYDYLSVHLFGEWTSVRQEMAIQLSVYGKFDLEMAKQLIGEHAEAILHDFNGIGSFMQFAAPNQYWFVEFFRGFLERELKKKDEMKWKALYELAAKEYEKKRDFAETLRCYHEAGRIDQVARVVIYLSENAEGCAFARMAYEYMWELSEEWEEKNPRILGAKVMLAAYRMQPEKCVEYMERLKQMADAEKGRIMSGDALAAYVRTSIACPYDTADKLKDNLLLYINYVHKNGFCLNNIMPTGNMPSLINGGLDLLPWFSKKTLLYPIIKAAAETVMGREAIGVADAAMGEALFEQNQSTKSMAYLTKALSAANNGGSIRVQYAVTAIMARLFISEGQADTAEEILHNLLVKIESEHFNELEPNIHTSIVKNMLLKQDMVSAEKWLREKAPDEHDVFYITERFRLMMKARIYVALDKTLEAIYILNLLEEFAIQYSRTYIRIEVLILKAIVLYRRSEEWKESLMEAVAMANPYGLVQIFSEQGAALLPLWKKIDWDTEQIVPDKLKAITKEMKQMALQYPLYLQVKKKYGNLSNKEIEVLRLVARGYNNGEIAKNLGVSLGTAKFHVGNIMKKLDAENRTVAVKIAQEEGLIS